MKKVIILAILLSGFSFIQPALTQPINRESQTPPNQAQKEDLIVVAARAIEDRKYKLALRVANNVTDLFPDYATGYLYRAIALFRLGEVQAAKLDFDRAKRLYSERLRSTNLSADQENEAHLGLKAIELHLQLLNSKL